MPKIKINSLLKRLKGFLPLEEYEIPYILYILNKGLIRERWIRKDI